MRWFALLLLVLGLGFFAGRWLKPPLEGAEPLQLQSDECREQRGSCLLQTVDGATLSMKFDRQAVALKPFRATLELQGWSHKLDAVQLQFEMVDMDMGLNRFSLSESGQVWSGEVILPICVTGRSDWLVAVRLRSGSQQWAGTLPFVLQSR